jgi:hypothetical protein
VRLRLQSDHDLVQLGVGERVGIERQQAVDRSVQRLENHVPHADTLSNRCAIIKHLYETSRDVFLAAGLDRFGGARPAPPPSR